MPLAPRSYTLSRPPDTCLGDGGLDAFPSNKERTLNRLGSVRKDSMNSIISQMVPLDMLVEMYELFTPFHEYFSHVSARDAYDFAFAGPEGLTESLVFLKLACDSVEGRKATSTCLPTAVVKVLPRRRIENRLDGIKALGGKAQAVTLAAKAERGIALEDLEGNVRAQEGSCKEK